MIICSAICEVSVWASIYILLATQIMALFGVLSFKRAFVTQALKELRVKLFLDAMAYWSSDYALH